MIATTTPKGPQLFNGQALKGAAARMVFSLLLSAVCWAVPQQLTAGTHKGGHDEDVVCGTVSVVPGNITVNLGASGMALMPGFYDPSTAPPAGTFYLPGVTTTVGQFLFYFKDAAKTMPAFPGNYTFDCSQTAGLVNLWVVSAGNAGEAASCSATMLVIDVNDITPPMITTCPPNTTFSCSSTITPAYSLVPAGSLADFTTAGGVASDNCTTITATYQDGAQVPGMCVNKFSFTRTWRVTDNSGNTTTCTQTINVSDNVAPTTTGTAGVLTLNCATADAAGIQLWIDNNTNPAANPNALNAGTVAGFISNTGGTLDASDACSGNIVTITPTFATGAQVLANMPPACSGAPRVVNVVFQVSDGCGNIVDVIGQVVLNDITAPTAVAPADFTVTCDVLPAPTLTTAYVTGSDDCTPLANLVVTSNTVAQVGTGNGCPGTPKRYDRTYTVTDCSNNSFTVTQVITFLDNVAPTWTTSPSPLTFACDAANIATTIQAWMDSHGTTGLATDNCPANTITYQINIPVQVGVAVAITNATAAQIASTVNAQVCAGGMKTITVDFIPSDPCGNVGATMSATVTQTDFTAPTITGVPANTTVNCAAAVPVPNAGGVTSSDNCSGIASTLNVIGLNTDNGAAGCPATPRIITYRYRVTDGCGNTADATQTITQVDNSAPTFTVAPVDFTIDGCAATASVDLAPWYTQNTTDGDGLLAEGTDDNGGAPCVDASITITANKSLAQIEADLIAAPCNATTHLRSTTVAFTPVDDCGNTGTPVTVNVSVRDMVSPTITGPSPLPGVSVQCAAAIPAPNPALVTATDNCTLVANLTIATLSNTNNGGTGCAAMPLVTTHTYQVTDQCGNTATVSQQITQIDNIAPNPLCTTVPLTKDLSSALDGAGTVTVNASDFNNGSTDNCTANNGLLTFEIARETAEGSGLYSPFAATQTFTCADIPDIANCGAGLANTANLRIQFRAIDPCGNVSSACSGPGTAVIIRDVTAPVIGTVAAPCPANFSVNTSTNGTGDCSGQASWTRPAAADNCSVICLQEMIEKENGAGWNTIQAATTVTGGSAATLTVSKGILCTDDTYRVTYTAKDEHGNLASQCQFIITVVDNEAPVVTCNGANQTYNLNAVAGDCYQFLSWLRPTATDNCAPPNGPCSAPTITVNAVSNPPSPGNVIINQLSGSPDYDGALFPVGQTVVTYTITDMTGNVSFCTMTVNVADVDAPTVMCAPNFTVNLDPNGTKTICFNDLTLANADNCMVVTKQIKLGAGAFTSSCITLTCANLGQNVFMAQVCDGAAPTPNCSVPCSVTVTLTDAVDPGFADCPADIAGTTGAAVTCDTTINLPIPTVYAAGCGSTVNATFVSATYIDGTRQAIGSPVVVTINGAAVPPAVPAVATTTAVGTFPVGTTTTRWKYEYTDAGGTLHTIYCNYNVVVTDNDKPVITCPAAVANLSCQDPMPAPLTIAAFTGGTLTDNCGVTQLLFSDLDNGYTVCAADPARVVTRTYTAFDAAGNSNTCAQTFTWVDDVVAPTLSAVTDFNGTCAAEVPAVPVVTASDNVGGCAGVTIDYEELLTGPAGTGVPACVNQFRITRSWVATDACGNTASTVQLVMAAIPAPAVVTATDNCSPAPNVTLTETEDPGPQNCANSRILTRTWRATDVCNNTSTFTQTITVNDNTPPTITPVVGDISLVCANLVAPAPVLTFSDNCTVVFMEMNESMLPLLTGEFCANKFRLVRTWKATDGCGNVFNTQQTVTVNDVTAPVLSNVPIDATVTCANSIPAPAAVTASDFCGPVVLGFTEYTIPGTCNNRYSIVRLWRATDDCGNTATASQQITVIDNTVPTLMNAGVPVAPANLNPSLTFQCAAQVPGPPTLTATDNCGTDVVVEYYETTQYFNCVDHFVVTRVWTATDNCGNQASYSQVVTVNDTQAPGWNEPAPTTPINLQCGSAVPAVPTQTATDNCGAPIFVDFSEVTDPGTCVNDFIITRTWTAQDGCGNQTQRIQVINVSDTQAPTLISGGVAFTPVTNPATLQCAQNVPAAPVVTATDNCDPNVNVIYSEELFPGTCANMFSIRRTWTAEDMCGNKTSTFQIWTVNDNTPPVLLQNGAPINPAQLPPTLNFQCAANVPGPPQNITASDNCGIPIDVDYVEFTQWGICINKFTTTRIWTATDDCGNSTSYSQVITVNDNTAPVLLLPNGNPVTAAQLPPVLTFQCAAQVPGPPLLTASDNCDGNITVEYFEYVQSQICNNKYIVNRRWTAVDQCGNSTTWTQVITVLDNTAPVLYLPNGNPVTVAQLPNTLVFQCAAQVPGPPTLTASDNCDMAINVVYSEYVQGQTCTNHYIVNRLWAAEDICGNKTTWTQVITVNDNTIPGWSTPAPATPLTFACAALLPAVPTQTATDNCGAPITVDFSETVAPGTCVNKFTVTRTWTAWDECGNSTSRQQVITIDDSVAPGLVSGGAAFNPTNPVNVSCAQDVPAAPVVTATDNCDPNVNVIYTEELQPGTCANKFTIKRTWTAEDICGNKTTVTQNITVNDVTAPTLIGLPAATFTAQCATAVPAVPVVTATDNCGVPIDVDFVESVAPGGCVNRFVMTRTWSASDDCGNATSFVQTITINDNIAPTLIGAPAQPSVVNVSCAQNVPAAAVVTATDNCDAAVNVIYTEELVPGTCANKFTIKRTWTAEDICGNKSTATQTINVDDTTAPGWVEAAPTSPLNFTCATQVPAVPVQTATDNCGVPVIVDFSETVLPGNCVNRFTLTRTWSVQDDCGNTTQRIQVINVNDNIAPTLIGAPAQPSVVNVSCAQNVPAAAVVTATDNCDAAVNVIYTEELVPGTCANKFTIKRTWTAEDICGNKSVATQTVNVDDTTAPGWVEAAPATPLNFTCATQVPAVPVQTATDNCGVPVIVDFSETVLPGNCVNRFTITRTWSVQDDCGNTTQRIQVINVNDNIAPTLIGAPAQPSVVNVSCAQNVPAAAVVTATDNCDAAVNVIYTEELVSGTCANSFSIKRTWTAEDICGNKSTATQTINVSDTQAPGWVEAAPASPLNFSCAIQVPPAPVQTATDNCGVPIIVDFVELDQPGPCVNKFTKTRIWTATDDCGNSTQRIQVINVNDNIAPVINVNPAQVPPVLVFQCAAQVPGPPVLTASDNCDGNVIVDYTEYTQGQTCTNHFIVNRKWTAIDACGNTSTYIQTITVNDNTAPVLYLPNGQPVSAAQLPPTLVFQCAAQVPGPPTLTASDNCDAAISVVYSETTQGQTCTNHFIVNRYWYAEDGCGNKTTWTQVVTVNDNTAPGWAQAAPTSPINIACASALPAVPVQTATDNCGSPVTMDFSETIATGTCVNKFTVTRTWTAWDECGNSTQRQQIINVNDNIAPGLIGTPAATVNVACSQLVPAAAVVTATDNCDPNVNVIYSEELQPGTCSNQFVIKRTWTAEDICGNKTTFLQTITVNDNIAPGWVEAAPTSPVNVSCASAVPAWPTQTATDNCGAPVIMDTNETIQPGTCVNKFTITRTWTAQDDCGNSTQRVQIINVNDNIAPTLVGTPAATVAVSCSQLVPAAAVVTATDNCDPNVNVIYSEELQPGTCANQFTIKRTWTAEDICGNKSTFLQTINVSDTQAPGWLEAAPTSPVNVSCASAIPALPVQTATDNCGAPIIVDTNETLTTGTCVNKFTLTRTWTATDDCGNSTQRVQVINVNDNVAPTLVGTPAASVTGTCAQDVPAAAVVTATDNCDPNVNVIYSEELVPGTCSNKFTIRRTWTAEDICGNKSTFLQTINIDDSVAPTWVQAAPASVTVSCSQLVPAVPVQTATDNCGVPVIVDFSETTSSGGCANNYTVTRTWNVQDDCGNSTQRVQVITVLDNIAPTFSTTVTSPINVDCASLVPAAPVVTATDNCGVPVIVDFAETTTPGACANKYTVTRTWNVQDDCGNATSMVQIINVNDNVAPQLSCPGNLTAQCSANEIPPYANWTAFLAAGGTASDNCQLNQGTFGLLSISQVGNIVTRTYRILDACGNSATCAQTITVIDNTPPQFLNCPNTTLVFGNDPDQCSAKINWPALVAVDNCSTPTVVQSAGPLSGTVVPVGNYTITYTATDAAGNTSTCTFTVMVMDTQKPQFDADIVMPGNITVECDAVPAPFVLTVNDVNDNCPGVLTIAFTEVRTNGNCINNYTLTRTWKVTDVAGNMTVHTQVITVKDTKPPVAKCKNITVTLNAQGTFTLTGALLNDGSTDNCSAAANLTFSVSPAQMTCANVGLNNVVTLTVTDQCGNSSTCTSIVTVLEGINPCTPVYDIAHSIKCQCLNNSTNMDNGQFFELVQIHALAGQTWTVAAGSTGMFLNSSAAPPAAPTPVPTGTVLTVGTADSYDNDGDGQTDEADESGYYTLRFKHIEGVGYAGVFANNLSQTLNIANKCYYPTPYFVQFAGPFCVGTPNFVIQVADLFGGAGTYTITIDGNPAPGNVFNATQLGVGPHTVVATFNAGTAGMNDQTDPGCTQSISTIVSVVTTPTAVACNDNVQVSLDQSCVVTITPDMVLEGGYSCFDDYTIAITYPAGTTTFNPANKVNASHAGKTMKVTLTHVASGNSCWGNLLVEDKLPPQMTCPANVTIQCSQSTSPSTTGNVSITDCSTFTSTYIDAYTDFGQCASPRAQIIRTWTATDKWGNAATCSQKITIAAFDLANVAFPSDVTLNCTDVGINPDLTNPDNTGRPTIGGSAIAAGSVCMASVSMTDEIYDICPNSYEILRTWKVRNMCLPVSATNPVTKTQIVKVSDAQGPVLDCPADFTVSVNPLVCKATLDVPDIDFFEACSGLLSFKAVVSNGSTLNYSYISLPPGGNTWIDKQTAVFGSIPNLPIGFYTITYTAEDNCANVSTCTVNFQVLDGIPPNAICQEYTQVAIGAGNVDNFTCPGETGPNGPLVDVPGDAIVPADAFNSGSFDACNNVWFKVRRMDGGSCSDTEFRDNVRFCCSDIGKEWMVVFRVYDVDPGAGQIAADAFEGHYADCMVTVLVEDKLKPSCQAPANKTVNCDEYDPLNWYGSLTFFDNCGIKNIDTAITYVPNQITFEQCNYGQVRRSFTVFDCANNSSRCTQTITVNYKELYRVYFPDDKNITVCNGATLLEQPQIFGENCELIGITHEDEVFTVVPDACYKIVRTFRVINWCTYNPNLPDQLIPNSNTSTQGARVWIGEGGAIDWANYNAQDPDAPTINAKTWTYPAPLVGNATNPEGTPAYVYTQVIKVQDATPPQANIDPVLGTANYTFCDYSTNDPLQWNQDASYNPWNVAGTWSPTCQSHDLCEGPVDLSIYGTDDCSDDNINFRYLLFLDLDGNGTMETTVNSEIPTLGFGIREDELVTNNGIKYRIGRVTRDFETDDPDHTYYSNFSLPYGTHKIKWTLEDRCGNDFTKEFTIIVKDCKNPTVVCINGLAVNQMNIPAGAGMLPQVTLWATDFLKYAEDNCTDASQIDLALRDADINPGTGFPLDANGQPQSSLSWDCSQIGTNVVELWARDKWGNADFCLTYLILSDNTGICTNPQGTIAGLVKTKPQFDDPTNNVGGVAQVDVNLEDVNPNPAFPGLQYFQTADDGQYMS